MNGIADLSESQSDGRAFTLGETGDDQTVGGETLSAQRRFGLLVFLGTETQIQLLDDGASLVVGRQPPSEVVIRDASVSRQHARFLRKQDEVWVEDLDSRNGTFCRGQRVDRRRLEPSDEVAIGSARVILAATCEAERRPAERAKDGEENTFVVHNLRMRQLFAHAERAAQVDLPVLVLGETGVGKEHVALAIHHASPRRHRPFVVINCAAIAPSLLESTLFGHERGAFTGATARTPGVFERADGGVLFLDEIGDLSSGAQAALLRAIETQRISRLGSSCELAVDVRIVAATHCDLEAMVSKGTFREDLYYRLSGIALEVPPLRERRDEIEPLADLFLAQTSRRWGIPRRVFTSDALDQLRRADWPGNVRQLRYAVERAALLATGPSIEATDWPSAITRAVAPTARPQPIGSEIGPSSLRQQLGLYERAVIEQALRNAGGNRQTAAKMLRLPLRTLFRRIRACGIVEGPLDSDR